MYNRRKLIESPDWYAGEYCVVCGSPRVQMDHVIGGVANRKISDRYGYVIPLCAEHHIGATGIHRNRGMDLFWKQTAQIHYEAHRGTRADFINEFGKSWI